MSDETQQCKKTKDKHAAAMLASAAIVVGFVVYWSVQIQAVREMLELAYG